MVSFVGILIGCKAAIPRSQPSHIDYHFHSLVGAKGFEAGREREKTKGE
jgi:hypothetical protein